MLHKKDFIVPIPGSRKPENLGGANIELTDEEYAKIEDKLSKIQIHGNLFFRIFLSMLGFQDEQHWIKSPQQQPNKALYPTAYSFARSSLRHKVKLKQKRKNHDLGNRS